jgi:hypothetical protein
MLRSILEPDFAKDPPIKVSLSATMLGGVVTVLGALGVLVALLAALGATAFAGAGLPFIVLVLLRGAGAGLAAYGGYQMYQYDAAGKNRVIYGIVLFFIPELLLVIYSPLSELFALLVAASLYYLVILSHFPVDTTPQTPAS